MSPHAELEFLNRDRKGEIYRLPKGRTVLGRVVGDLIINDRECSSIHAIVSFERGGWYLMDLGSTNGVYLEGKPTLEARLRSGNRIRLGQTRLVFREVHGSSSGDSEISFPGPSSFSEEKTMPSIDRDAHTAVPQPVRTPRPSAIGPDLGRAPRFNPNNDFDTEDLQTGQKRRSQLRQKIELEVIDGNDIGLVHSSRSPVILLGRVNADIELQDRDVSRRHALLEVYDDDQVYIRDLSSTNGTFVNGRRIVTARLRTGDTLRLGRCKLVFRFGGR